MADHQYSDDGGWGSFPDAGGYAPQQLSGGDLTGNDFGLAWGGPAADLASATYASGPTRSGYPQAGGNAPIYGANYPAGLAGSFVPGQNQNDVSMPPHYNSAHFQQPGPASSVGPIGDSHGLASRPTQRSTIAPNQNILASQHHQGQHVAYAPQQNANGDRAAGGMAVPQQMAPQQYAQASYGQAHASSLHQGTPGPSHHPSGVMSQNDGGYGPQYGHQIDQRQQQQQQQQQQQYQPQYQPQQVQQLQQYQQQPVPSQGHQIVQQQHQLPPQHQAPQQQRALQQQQPLPPQPQLQIQQVQFPSQPPRQQAPSAQPQPRVASNSAAPPPSQSVPQQGYLPRPAIPAPAKKKYDLNNPPPVVVNHDLLKSRPVAGYPNFRNAPYLVVGGQRLVQVPASLQDPAAMADPAKKLGLEHFPGSSTPLPCEIIFDYDNKVVQEPARKAALTKELTAKLNAMGKNFDSKIFKLGKTPRKSAASTTPGAATATTPESMAESDYEEEEEVRSPTRPTDQFDLAAWEAIGYVHIDSSDDLSVKTAVKDFGNFLKGLYDPFKDMHTKLADLAKKLKATPGDKASLQEEKKLRPEFAAKAEMLYRAIAAAGEKGDDRVLENLGSNEQLVARLFGVLRMCLAQDEVNGNLSRACLRLTSQITTLQDRTLKSLKFPKIQDRIREKGDEVIKELLDETLANVKGSLTQPPTSSKFSGNSDAASESSPSSHATAVPARPTPGPSAPSASKTPLHGANSMLRKPDAPKGTRVASDSSPQKRQREDDSDPRAPKKLATDSSDGKPATFKSASTTLQTPNRPLTGALPGKMRPTAKPTLPGKGEIAKGTSTVKREAVKQDPLKPVASKVKKPATTKAEAAPSVSKLGMILQEIAKPKAPEAAPTPDSSSETPETPEEKAKRLRKESRRKLRVSWKEGDELTQVRIFEKGVAEDEGREMHLLRDARDDRSEGMALKQSLKKAVTFDDDDEDDIPYRPWVEPTPVDLGPIPAEKKEKTYTTRGGNLEVRTEQQRIMQERENTVLMALYTDPSDIPPTPKSPPLLPADKAKASPQGIYLPANDGKFAEIHTRWSETRTQGPTGSLWSAMRRADVRRHQHAAAAQSSGVANVLKNIQQIAATASQAASSGNTPAQQGEQSSQAGLQQASQSAEVFRLLTSDKVKNWQAPARPQTQRHHDYPDPALQRDADAVEDVAARLKGLPFPPTEPPQWIKDPARIKEWHEGVRKDKERKAREFRRHQEAQARQDAEARLAQQTHTPAAATAMPNGQQDYTAAWQAYYAQIAQTHGPEAAAAAQQQQQQQQQQQYAQYYAQYHQQQQQQHHQQAAAATPGLPAPDANAQLQALLSTLGGNAATTSHTPQQPATASQVDPALQALLAAVGGNAQVPSPYQQQQQQQPGAAIPNPSDPAYQAYSTQWANNPQQATAPAMQQSGSADQPGDRDGMTTGYGQRASQPHRDPQQHHETFGSDNRGGGGGGGNSSGNGRAHGRNKRDRDRENKDSETPAHLRGINRALIGTKPCVFWATGKCAKGDKCTFRHD